MNKSRAGLILEDISLSSKDNPKCDIIIEVLSSFLRKSGFTVSLPSASLILSVPAELMPKEEKDAISVRTKWVKMYARSFLMTASGLCPDNTKLIYVEDDPTLYFPLMKGQQNHIGRLILFLDYDITSGKYTMYFSWTFLYQLDKRNKDSLLLPKDIENIKKIGRVFLGLKRIHTVTLDKITSKLKKGVE